MWAVGTNSKILGGPEQTGIYLREHQQEVQSNPGPRTWRTYWRSASRRQPLKYVQRRSYAIVRMSRTCRYFYVLFTCCHDYLITHYFPHILELSTVLIFVCFHRLKINHSWIRHHREQFLWKKRKLLEHAKSWLHLSETQLRLTPFYVCVMFWGIKKKNGKITKNFNKTV